ncbi:MAG: VWA domain-containing protein [Acidobacteria bacterium]|nr:VWA domain-containing protein [Acidobacteriota bacterium]
MQRSHWGPCCSFIPVVLLLAFLGSSGLAASAEETAGALKIFDKKGTSLGECPLQHTDVQAAISGFLARVTVTQVFANSAKDTIEAVYVFPLPEDAAVDDMTMRIGERTIRGVIKRREEARALYEKAKQNGQVAALLDQERPNIFTQAVANILPGEQVTVTIRYLQTLHYADNGYQFVFPMVVGPRYIPGGATGKQAGGWSPDTDKVPDGSRITPPITRKGTRAGHDISLALALDAGVPIQDLHSPSHRVEVVRTGDGTATVKLRDEAVIPNQDFILKYEVAGARLNDAVLSQAAPAGSKVSGGYFTLILQPPARVAESDITPKELVFVLDTSGSMHGFPLEKGKELVLRALDELYAGDTFNLITFSGDTEVLFPEPVFPTAENLRRAKEFLQQRSGGGGTEMMKAIRAALDPSDAQDHLRIVCFVTDGFVGNDMEILGEIQKHANARVFSFGIGSSVNRFLIEGMARAGRGEAEVVTLKEKAGPAARRLYQHLRAPLLTDLSLDWGDLPVADVSPARLPDLFSGGPLVITGRYTGAASGKIQLHGKRVGEDFTREIAVNFSGTNRGEAATSVLPGFWARRKIDDLMAQDWSGLQSGRTKPEVEKQITQLGLDYRLLTQFTSFVAVEERVVSEGGTSRRVEVPVEMPEGVSYEGIEGDKFSEALWQRRSNQAASPQMSGGLGGIFMAKRKATMPPPPPPPPTSIPSGGNSDKASMPAKPAGERAILESKLHPRVLAAYDCAKKGEGNCSSLVAGKIEVEIRLTRTTAETLVQLKSLGWEEAAPSSKSLAGVVVGKLPVEKLMELARMPEVQFVSLVRR